VKDAFIDSGAFIAFLDASDGLHEHVVALFAEPPRRLFTSVLVVAESYGWLLHRLGEPEARRLRTLLRDLPMLEVLGADAKHLSEAERRLDRLQGRRLSMVDASSLVLLAARRIVNVWGTDLDLALEGATVSPGPDA
jgi:predicted nucleic acid-binding protein